MQEQKRTFNWKPVIIVSLAVIILAGGTLAWLNLRHRDVQQSSDPAQQENNVANMDDGQLLSRGQCQGDDKPLIGTLPMNEADFSTVLPYGLTIGGHVTPIDHQYFSPTVFTSPRDAYPVYAMANANIVDIGERSNERGTEYRLVFSMSCKLFYYYDLVTSLTPEIKTAYDNKDRNINIPIKAGDLIGRIGGQTLDFAVWDMDSYLTHFIHPDLYKVETWKIHTVDPLQYYTDELKAKALAKYLRSAEPRSGRIDYDIPGKLQGSWFLEGTNGYAGLDRSNYWVGHLSIAPDYLDPSSIVISMGDYGGEAKQFGVSGNSPDPAVTGVADGLVKYELVQQDWADASGRHWDRTSLASGLKAQNQTTVMGTVLLQVLDGEKLRFEAFPNKTAAQVPGFTENAKIYER